MTAFKNLARALVPRSVRNWWRAPVKTAHYLYDHAKFSFGHTAEVRITDQWSLRCHPASRTHFRFFSEDREQASELATFFRLAAPGMRLLDIGAHYGFFTLAALKAGGPKAQVLAVEPSKNAIEVMNNNLLANGVKNRVTILNAALSNHNGAIEMLTTGPSGNDYLLVPTESRKDTIAIPSFSLATLLVNAQFTPTHIKLDVEGSEFEVIEGSLSTLSSLAPIIFLELHGKLLRARGKDPKVVITMLRQAGYNSILMDGNLVDDDALFQCNFDCRLVCIPQLS